MAKFVFKLEPLLEARRRREQGRQREVAEVERERLALERMLREHQREIGRGKQELRERLAGPLDMRRLRQGSFASLHRVRKAQQVVLQLAGVHRRLDEARGRLLEATRRRRAIELLRDRRFQQWKTALDKAETAMLDDLAGRRAPGRLTE